MVITVEVRLEIQCKCAETKSSARLAVRYVHIMFALTNDAMMRGYGPGGRLPYDSRKGFAACSRAPSPNNTRPARPAAAEAAVPTSHAVHRRCTWRCETA